MCWINTKKATCECPFSLLHPLKPKTEWFLRQYHQTSKKTPFIPPRERDRENFLSLVCTFLFLHRGEATLNAAHVCPWHLFAFIVPVRIPRVSLYSRGVFRHREMKFFHAPPPPPTLYRGPPLNFVSNRVKWIFRKEMNIEIPDIHSPSLSTCEWVLIEI